MLTTALQFLQACQVWGMRGMVFPGIWVPWFSGHLVFLQTCRVQLKVGEEVLANLFLLMEDKLEPGKRFRDYDLLAETKVNHEMSVDIDAQVQDFLKLARTMPILGRDIAEAADVAIWNVLKNEFTVCPESTMCFCSWVCHDVCSSQSLAIFVERSSGFMVSQSHESCFSVSDHT